MTDASLTGSTKDSLLLLKRAYTLRRPMLTHVATSVKSELQDLLEDEGCNVGLSQSVLTGDQFIALVNKNPSPHPLVECTSQISVRVISYGDTDIHAIREILETHYQSIEVGWELEQSHLTLSVLIPPQSKPEGYRERNDLPTRMQISVVASRAEPRMTIEGSPIPKLALIMKGGGIKGLAYVGALEMLQDQYDFSWYVGTSAGAISAVLLAAGFSIEELKEILEQKDFRDFFDAKWFSKPGNLIFKQGLHPAKAFTDWMDVLLAKKLEQRERVTLGDIESKTGNRVTVFASQQRRKALTFDSTDTPDTSAAYAARCSMSIPIVFIPEKNQGVLAFDGGLQNNFPIQRMIEVHGEIPFISFFLGAENFEPIKEGSLFLQLLDIVLGQGEDEYVAEYKEQTVVVDPRPIGTLDFDLSKDEKDYLVTCGKIGALRHLLPTYEHSADEELTQALQIKSELSSTTNTRCAGRRRKTKAKLFLAVVAFLGAMYYFGRWCLVCALVLTLLAFIRQIQRRRCE